MAVAPLWFSPICDALLAKFQLWVHYYERGEVYATRDFLDYDGQVKPKPTAYSHKIPLSHREMVYLLDLWRALRPDGKDIQGELEQVAILVGKGKGRVLPGGYRLVTLNFYKQVLEEIVEAMLEARDGRKPTLEDLQEPGKDLFEV